MTPPAMYAAPAPPSNEIDEVGRSFHVDSRCYWVHTGLMVRKGLTYRFEIPPGQRWHDWFIESPPEGYPDGFVQRLWRPLLRLKRSGDQPVRFFALIATVGEALAHASPVRADAVWTAPADGELVCFANDVPGFYWNNRDAIRVVAKRVAPARGAGG